MKFSVRRLKQPEKLVLSGDEPWLARIYGQFPARKEGEKITGEFTLARVRENVIHITGRIEFSPHVECSRCAIDILWPMTTTVDVEYEEEGARTPEKGGSDLEIVRADLDRYFFKGGEIDFEELVNDSIDASLPSRFIRATADGKSCGDCGVDISGDEVYRDAESDQVEERSSPFAVLGK